MKWEREKKEVYQDLVVDIKILWVHYKPGQMDETIVGRQKQIL